MSHSYTKTVFDRNSQYTASVIHLLQPVDHYTGMAFRTNLIRLRKERGWQQDELAERVGVAQETVSRWETGGREPRGKLRLKLAEALSVPEAELFLERGLGAPEQGAFVSLPVQLPTASVLTRMFQTLLEQTATAGDEGERARMLARSFPSTFQAHLSLQGQRASDEENIVEVPLHAGGEARP
ncbi:helix-turn-helix transcriptional regulator [Sphingobium sp. SYK-6]|uniref:helix-turn-helix transcriptional regulator n=1 Tax=Sphingobium sp. (strain NBRC 103272 / SYK-6) TaxID=627192 RepID=UPI000A00F57E|nr:helix-turn-helix transcriptional regulator [Sphingobium sp. SYK-6]